MSDQVTAREVAERLIADHTYVSAGGDRVLVGRHGFAEAITAALAAAVAGAVPDGYVVVPREPTDEMLRDGVVHLLRYGRVSNGLCNAYRAMLNAAIRSPQEPDNV